MIPAVLQQVATAASRRRAARAHPFAIFGLGNRAIPVSENGQTAAAAAIILRA
jgi:hypothetical protein